MKWCRRCILPDTRPNLALGADGVCNACKAHESKARIDWPARARAFRLLAEQARAQRRRLPDDAIARAWFEATRWPDGPCFPHCGSMDVQSNIKHPTMTHRCRACPKRRKHTESRLLALAREAIRRRGAGCSIQRATRRSGTH